MSEADDLFERQPLSPNWEDYAPFVADLGNVYPATELANYHTRVVESSLDDEHLIIRFPGAEEQEDYEATFENRLRALLRGVGHMALEQLVAYSTPDQVVVTEFIEAKTLNELTAAEVRAITREQLQGMLTTIEDMYDRGVVGDNAAPSNYFYDPAQGFRVIDYGVYDPDFVPTNPVIEYADLLYMMGEDAHSELPPGDELREAWMDVIRQGREVLLAAYPAALAVMRQRPTGQRRRWLETLDYDAAG